MIGPGNHGLKLIDPPAQILSHIQVVHAVIRRRQIRADREERAAGLQVAGEERQEAEEQTDDEPGAVGEGKGAGEED